MEIDRALKEDVDDCNNGCSTALLSQNGVNAVTIKETGSPTKIQVGEKGDYVEGSINKIIARIDRGQSVVKRPTSYVETLIHVVKGNIGAGMFAMGDAFKNAGLLLGPILTLILGSICIYGNHLLAKCSNEIRKKYNLKGDPTFPETVDICFDIGPPSFRRFSNVVRASVKVFICVTQLGFCCVYFVLVSSTARKVALKYNYDFSALFFMTVMLFPVILTCVIRSLKILTPVSLVSNALLCMGVVLTIYISSLDLPPISSRKLFANWEQLPLFFGTVVYAFEGISLVIPLKNEMKDPRYFGKTFGVLNMGMAIVMCILISLGFIGYLKYGEGVFGSMTLNMPEEYFLTDVVQVMIALGIILSYALQFYVAAELIWIDIDAKFGPFKRATVYDLMLRVVLILFTYVLAAVVPNLGLFISLIGAVSSTALALLFPPLCDLALRFSPKDPLVSPNQKMYFLADGLMLVIALFGFVLGTYFSLAAIIYAFTHPEQASSGVHG